MKSKRRTWTGISPKAQAVIESRLMEDLMLEMVNMGTTTTNMAGNDVYKTSVSHRELDYRIKFAEICPVEQELRNAVAKFPTWKQIITKVLTTARIAAISGRARRCGSRCGARRTQWRASCSKRPRSGTSH